MTLEYFKYEQKFQSCIKICTYISILKIKSELVLYYLLYENTGETCLIQEKIINLVNIKLQIQTYDETLQTLLIDGRALSVNYIRLNNQLYSFREKFCKNRAHIPTDIMKPGK